MIFAAAGLDRLRVLWYARQTCIRIGGFRRF